MKNNRPGPVTSGRGGKTISSTAIISDLDSLCTPAAVLADRMATIAARTRRAHDACAAIQLCEAAHHAWRAAEALCEGARHDRS